MALASTFASGPGAGGADVYGGNQTDQRRGGIFYIGDRATHQVDTSATDANLGLGDQFAKASQLNPQYEADRAATDVQNKAEAGLGAVRRRERGLGISADSGRSRNRERNSAIAIAAAKAAAANKGRRGAQEVNRNMALEAAKLGLQDRGMNLRERAFKESLVYDNSGRSFQSRRGEARALREARDYERGQLQEDKIQGRVDRLIAQRQANAPKGVTLPTSSGLYQRARKAVMGSMAQGRSSQSGGRIGGRSSMEIKRRNRL